MISNQQRTALTGFYRAALASGHIYPKAAACEAVVETNWGTSGLYLKAANIFGMKQHAHPKFGTVNVPTKEFLHGAWVTIDADFVKYPDLAAAFSDRMATLVRLAPVYPHYARALAATTAEEYVTEVSLSWSTGPTRGADCVSILHSHPEAFTDI